jgi:hypothetical protein
VELSDSADIQAIPLLEHPFEHVDVIISEAENNIADTDDAKLRAIVA